MKDSQGVCDVVKDSAADSASPESIVDRCPISGGRLSLSIPSVGQPAEFAPRQLVIWISVTVPDAATPGRPFPAVLDTGCNDSLVISEPRLRDWGDVSAYAELIRVDVDQHRPKVRGVEAARFMAQVWLHPNQPGSVDADPAGVPVELNVPDGIVVFPVTKGQPTDQLPRLPLIGLSAFLTRDWAVLIQTKRRQFDILPLQ